MIKKTDTRTLNLESGFNNTPARVALGRANQVLLRPFFIGGSMKILVAAGKRINGIETVSYSPVLVIRGEKNNEKRNQPFQVRKATQEEIKTFWGRMKN